MRKYLILFSALFLCQCHYYKKTNTMVHKFNFYTSYNQFYLENKETKANTGASDFWSDQSFLDGLALEKGVIGVSTRSYGVIKGEIEILDKPKESINFDLYDHIVEGGIDIDSGELQILNCPDSHLELSLKVTPGKYRIRIYGSNFASVKEHDLANDTDNDYYRIEMWKSDNMERKVLKRFNFNE